MKVEIRYHSKGFEFYRGWFVQSLNNPTNTAIEIDDYNKIWIFKR